MPKNFGSETFFSGGGGLFSTKCCTITIALRMNASFSGGELEGVRILKPETIATMTTNQIGKNSAFGAKYGLGFGLLFGRGPSDAASPFWNAISGADISRPISGSTRATT